MQLPDSESKAESTSNVDAQSFIVGIHNAAQRGAWYGAIQGALTVAVVVGLVEAGAILVRVIRARNKQGA